MLDLNQKAKFEVEILLRIGTNESDEVALIMHLKQEEIKNLTLSNLSSGLQRNIHNMLEEAIKMMQEKQNASKGKKTP